MADQLPSKFKVLEKLPLFFPDLLRFRAAHAETGREFELRVIRRVVKKPVHRVTLEAFDELRKLDHPAFLPVLEHGEFANCVYYAVPFRRHPRLDSLLASDELDDPARVHVLKVVAAALAAAHAQGVLLGTLQPALIALDPDTGSPYFVMHGLAPGQTGLPPEILPADLRAPNPKCLRGDLFSFGLLACALMARRNEGHELAPAPGMPFRYLEPTAPAALAKAVARCLTWKAGDGFANGAELLAALKEPGVLALGDDEAGGLSASLARVRARQAREQPAVASEPDEVEDSALAGVADWIPRPGPASPAPAPATPDPNPTPALLGLGLCLAAVAGFALSTGGGPRPPPELPGGAGIRPPTQTAAPPAAFDPKRARNDPRIPHLLDGGATGGRTFGFRWKLLRQLALGGLVPAELIDDAGLMKLKELGETDPAAAALALDKVLAAYATRLEYAGWKAP